MLFVPEVWQDIRKYYEGSYVKFLEYGETLFNISRVREDEIVGEDEDGNAFSLALDSEAPYELTYTLPHKGLFMFEGSAHLLHRSPAVQYSRGVTSGNTKIFEIASGKTRPVGFKSLKAYVSKGPYTSIQDALYGKNKEVSVCLSRRLAFLRTKQVFYVDSFPIAIFDRKTSSILPISPTHRCFFPEIKALCKEGDNLLFT